MVKLFYGNLYGYKFIKKSKTIKTVLKLGGTHTL